MTVKDVIKVQAMLVGREDVVDYLSGKTNNPSTVTLSATDVMVRCINLTIGELANTYVPMIASYVSSGSEVHFSDLPEQISEVISVKDRAGSVKEYIFHPEKITGLSVGDVLEYSYIPPNYDLEDVIGYSETQLPVRLLAYAGASEYCLTERAFDESVMWRDRYINDLAILIRPKNTKIKARGWY